MDSIHLISHNNTKIDARVVTSMEFKQGGSVIQRIRKEKHMTQEQLAGQIGITSNNMSRIERGLMTPALPTLIRICNALETDADSILAAYIAVDPQVRWSPLAAKLENLPPDKQDKIEAILKCLIETI